MIASERLRSSACTNRREQPMLTMLCLGVAVVMGVAAVANGLFMLVSPEHLYFWEVAVGICAPSVIARDFPAVTLPAVIGTLLTLWAVHDAQTDRDVATPLARRPEARFARY